jgi:ABC-type lipoprotein export system ATPase subunit
VLVTHDPTIGASASRLLRMRDGRLVGDHRQSNDEPWAAVDRRQAVAMEG